ncbi:MAG: aromatic ring-hydroxylating dioxygenase subunit alpha [Rhodospirillaceae bacterium]
MFLNTSKPWPHNAWYHAAWNSEVETGAKPVKRTLLNEDVIIYRDLQGEAHVLEDRCCHRATPLSLGEVVEEGLQCGYHGLIFGGDGKCVSVPGSKTIPSKAKVRSYPTVEHQEIIWVWMGDPAKANVNKIIDFPWNDDHENWPHIHDCYEIECNYNLLIDNLMDLTHIPYIHRNTIGGGDQKGQVNAEFEVTPKDTGVHYIRWMENIMPPPTYKLGAGWHDDQMCDRWQEFEYKAPTTVDQWTGALEVGRNAREFREGKPGGFNIRLYHGVTPRTETSCYYFWTAHNGYRPQDPEATKILHEQIAFTFNEDLEFLEEQQRCMAATQDQELVNIKHDAALVPARKAIERMINEETTPPPAAQAAE